MGVFGAGGWLVVGVILVVLGILLRSGLIQWLLNLMGFLLIIVGVIAIIVALVSLVTGSKRRSSGF